MIVLFPKRLLVDEVSKFLKKESVADNSRYREAHDELDRRIKTMYNNV